MRFSKTIRIPTRCWLVACAAVALAAPPSLAVDIEGVQAGAIDPPRVNGFGQPGPRGQPDTAGLRDVHTLNISAFLDTGSSGIILSESTADALGVPRTPGVKFADVAIGGNTEFDVTPLVNVRVAPSTAADVDNLATFQTVYNQAYPGVRLQI